MTDRELLELAAKAAGYIIEEMIHDGSAWVYQAGSKKDEYGDWPIFKWHPCGDDGDALRLAVRLRMTVCVDNSMTDVEDCAEAHIGDPYSATRRAIVRAAAEIGRAR